MEGGESPYIVIEGETIDFEPETDKENRFTLTFPLYEGKRWGSAEMLENRDDGYYVWEVEEKSSKEVLEEAYDNCYKISYKTLSDTTYKIFC